MSVEASAATAASGWARAIEPGRADGRLVAESTEAARAAENVEIPAWLAPELRAALIGGGIASLYSHQLEALETAAEENVVVTSGTASGKSLAFNLPVLDALARDDRARALYLYPTKALAQDQARKLS
jgi:DEAD/DEAH box helicase domain-containing protein